LDKAASYRIRPHSLLFMHRTHALAFLVIRTLCWQVAINTACRASDSELAALNQYSYKFRLGRHRGMFADSNNEDPPCVTFAICTETFA